MRRFMSGRPRPVVVIMDGVAVGGRANHTQAFRMYGEDLLQSLMVEIYDVIHKYVPACLMWRCMSDVVMYHTYEPRTTQFFTSDERLM